MLQRSPCLPSCLAASALLLGACTESVDAPAAAAPTVTNAGLVAEPAELAGDGDLWLVAAREFEAGGRDLDQDGDALDLVVFVVDLVRNTTQNTALAVTSPLSFAVRDGLAAFAASESAGPARDRNGDGDVNDDVLFVYDSASGRTRDQALALTPGTRPAVGDGLVAFSVSEAAQGGVDLDGDGSATGDVLHVFDGASGTSTNTRMAVASPLFLGDGRVAYLAFESMLESGDENGDGDALDLVLQVFDPATGTNQSSGLASDGAAPLVADGVWLVAVPERAQGGLDANGDGDVEDAVLHVFDPRTEFVRNLRLACPGPGCAVASRPMKGQASFGILAQEDGVDRNRDGDGLDAVAFTYDPRADRLRNSGVAAVLPLVFAGSSFAFRGLEAAQDEDLNGDGDLLDAVAFLDPLAGRTTNLGQDALDLRGSEAFLLLARAESTSGSDSNGVDSNRDGDRADVVVHAFAPATGRTTDTRIASRDVFGASASEILLYVGEADEGRDLNGDRDLADEVFVLFDVPAAASASLNLAGGTDEARFASLSPSGRLVLLASELAQGTDLDADGDLSDQVFHRSH